MDAELYFQLGVWIFENGKALDINYRHRAMDEFDKAKAINPQEGKYHFHYGLCSIDMGNPEATTNASFNKAIHLGYKVEECKRLMAEAKTKYDAEYKKAHEDYLDRLEKEVDGAHKFGQLGSHYYWKDKKKAIALLERALEFDPNDGNANVLLGRYYGEQGDMEKALEHFKRAGADSLKYGSGYRDNHYDEMASIYEKKEDWENALIWRKKGYELYPDEIWNAQQYGIHLYKFEKQEEALAVFMKILEMNPEGSNTFVYTHLASYHSNKGDIETTLKYLHEGLKYNAQNWFFHFNLGHIHEYTKQYDLAEKFFLNAVVYRLDDDAAYIRLGKMNLREDYFDIKKSRDYFVKALEINSLNIIAHEKLSEIYMELNEPTKAKYHQSKTQELRIQELYPNPNSKDFLA